MPAVHSARAAAQTRIREVTVARHSIGSGSRRAGRLPPGRKAPSSEWMRAPVIAMCGSVRLTGRDDGLFRRRGGCHALDDDRLAASRRHQMELLGRDLLDAPRRAERLDLERKVPVDLLFRGALLLHPLDLITVPEQLEVLPRGEEYDNHEEQPNAHGSPELPLARLVDLADDRVVANVLLDRVLEVHSAHANLSIARSFALRARGLRATSSSAAVSGRLVRMRRPSPVFSRARKVCFTMRSSSE